MWSWKKKKLIYYKSRLAFSPEAPTKNGPVIIPGKHSTVVTKIREQIVRSIHTYSPFIFEIFTTVFISRNLMLTSQNSRIIATSLLAMEPECTLYFSNQKWKDRLTFVKKNQLHHKFHKSLFQLSVIFNM